MSRHRTETCLKVLLLIRVVTAAPMPSLSPLPTHEDAVLAAVQIYNQEPGTTLAYRLLEAEPQPDWDMSSKTIQPLTFTVQETACLVSEKHDVNQCEFKEDGVVINRYDARSWRCGTERRGARRAGTRLFTAAGAMPPANIPGHAGTCIPLKHGAPQIRHTCHGQNTFIHPTSNYRSAWFLNSGLLLSAGALFYRETLTEVKRRAGRTSCITLLSTLAL
ncbi:antimicrobial protein CAP18-like [Gopherus flavomarginatus]|uniref:antimicrobial protein CAP18-like n=1 Tax=Gopherus flavomarginatus TaxID=286002 RepID=UPI0021CBBB64|nr:antimicrobial protein CAP18-like [Gopherus flavomarginatus]